MSEQSWGQKNIHGNSESLLKLAQNLAELHRLTIEQKLREMKNFVNLECAKLDHPAAKAFAEEINKLQVNDVG